MAESTSYIQKGNPLRPDLRWEFVMLQGIIAVGIGIYAIAAEASAQKNIVFLIGIFLLFNGLGLAIGGIRRGSSADPMLQFRLVRSGIGIATGLLVVLNRFMDFMSVNSARVVVGIGLLGMGIVTLIGVIMLIDKVKINLGAIGAALLLSVWGAASLYQARNDANSSRIIGWAALIIGAALIALALLRRQRAGTLTPD